ncbi:MAG TPA: TlyA family RNA methyltransferase [Syntrophales bacterium]|nr:TlyA family RNA methyltransferase [Syntrophales bacterium]
MGGKPAKIRLDRLLVERGLAATPEIAQSLVLSGDVLIDGTPVDKAGTLVAPGAAVRLRGQDHPYVSRGGVKLKGALDAFGLEVRGRIALDVGASTGGFTDCLLQEGVSRVYAVDVGYGQLAWKLRQDDRVVPVERTNIRRFDGSLLEEDVDLVTIDVSFISLRRVLPAVLGLLHRETLLLMLVKPQFEVAKGDVGKGGVVRDPEKQEAALRGIEQFCREAGLEVLGTCESPVCGPAGNREFFVYAKKGEGRNG